VDDSTPLSAADLARVATRLEAVRLWAATRSESLPVASRYRSATLAPDLEESLSPASLEATLYELAGRRDAARATDPGPVCPGGRLLVCEIDMSIGDGRSEAASEGFFDIDDRPPWDLWLVSHGRRRREQPVEPITCLLVWVPESLVPYAQAGITANRCGCLYWPTARLGEQLEVIGR
jgi:hypothetical protein